MMNTSWLQTVDLEGKKAVIIHGSINYSADTNSNSKVGKCVDFKGRKLWLYTAAEVCEEQVVPWFWESPAWGCVANRLVDASRILCCISAAGFLEEMRDETTECLSAVQLCPSLLNPLSFHTSASEICGMLNPPANQSRRQQALLTLAETKTLSPPSLCGERQHHMRMFIPGWAAVNLM